MNHLIRTTCLAAACALSACSGSNTGAGGGAPPPGPPPEPPPAPPPPAAVTGGGLWQGTLQYGYNDEIEPALALITEDGRFRLLSLSSNVALAGDAGLVATPYDSRGQFFEGRFDPAYSYAINLWVEATERERIAADWSSAWETWGTIELAYVDWLYESPSSLSDLAGTWTGLDDAYEAWVNLDINDDGSFGAEDVAGCETSGRLKLVDTSFNLYEAVEVTFDCDPDGGDYAGFGYLIDASDVPAPGLFLTLTNDDQAIRLSAYRLDADGGED